MSLLKLDPETVAALAKELAPLLIAALEQKLLSNQTKLLNVQEAATSLNVHPSWLKRRTSDKWQATNGSFPHTQIGKSVRFSECDMENIRKMKS